MTRSKEIDVIYEIKIDGLILRYRDLACDENLPSFGARPKSSNQQPKPAPEVEDLSIDLQLSQRLLMPILESIYGVNGSAPAPPSNEFGANSESPLKWTDGKVDLLNPLQWVSALSPNFSSGLQISAPHHLIFIPDGALNFLPIGNLPLDESRTTYLNDRFVCTYLSTLRELLTRSDRPNQSLNPSIAIGNPNYNYLTPALTPEVFKPIHESQLLLNSLKLQLDSDAQFFTGDRATETVLLAAKSPKLLVIITHGELLNRDGDPMQNHGLALTGANAWLAGEKLPTEIGKGFLLARDVAYLDLLGTEIVFLIACSSGLGDVKTGEGVFGLRRAFAIAGVKQLITSLWNVPTRPTMLLTDKFFEAYHQGVAPSIALQTAQHYVHNISRTDLESMSLGKKILDELERHSIRIADPNYPLRHPYFWGAWICQGV